MADLALKFRRALEAWRAVGTDAIDYRLLAEANVDGIFVLRVGPAGMGHMLYASPSCEEIVGYPPAEFIKLEPADLYPPASLAVIAGDIERILAGASTTRVELEMIHSNGNQIWLENRVRVLERPRNGEPLVLVAMRDQTERRNQIAALSRQALIDPLTGVGNRRAFDKSLDREWKRTLRTGHELSLVLLDVDHFKEYNDTFGHHMGDQCLRSIASAVRAVLQRPGDEMARYGGEEFGLLLPDTDAAGAEHVARHVCQAVTGLAIPHPLNQEGDRVVTISCGITTALPRLSASFRMPDALIWSADSALYRAKARGRNRIESSFLLSAHDMMHQGR
jgi:diguanylate cyclase (GGDEF)-like protein/PAS domain S-box-containing protein